MSSQRQSYPNRRRSRSQHNGPQDQTLFRILVGSVAMLLVLCGVTSAMLLTEMRGKTPAQFLQELRGGGLPSPTGAAPGTEGDPGTVVRQPSAAPPLTGGQVEWFNEAVDLNPKTGIFSTLVAAPDGALYAAYLDDANDALKLARRQDSGWSVTGITNPGGGSSGFYPSLAFDPQGMLHVAYYSVADRQVQFGSLYADGAWQIETAVDGTAALDVSFAIDAQNNPYISFFDDESEQLRWAERTGGGWTAAAVAPASPEGVVYPLGVDGQNRLHAAWMGSEGGLFYGTLEGASWAVTAVDASPTAGAYPALAFDASGGAHISYYDAQNQDLKYARQDASGWRTFTADAEGSVGKHTSIQVDRQGMVHISYFDEGGGALKYALGRDDAWTRWTVAGGGVGIYNSLALDQNGNPGITYFDDSANVLMFASADVYRSAAQPNRLFAVHRSGQTFLTWTERSDLRGERYSIYRSSQPVTAQNLSRAALLAQVGEHSSRLWANWHVADGFWSPRLTDTFIIEDHAAPLGGGAGAFVWTPAAQDFGGSASGQSYYAVTITESGSDAGRLYAGFTVGPVDETVAEPAPVEITGSPGLRMKAGPGGHYYIQYMDFRHWNATFHAPNSTNLHYGFDPADPAVKNALAYAYDYAVFEPTPDLCGGSVPDKLPVMIFLHGARGNRYGTPDVYTYPYCAYGVYPIDETETWYFGFARQHDYRTSAPFSKDDVIENYTEQRILRMVYDLMRQPPGPAVDEQRVYLFGHSMGGTGSLAFAERYPNVFAAIYSGQPVTHFYATEGYAETWPENLATKWGPQEMNLPVALSAPNGWADRLAKYNGAGVFTWQNLRGAFDPGDPLRRIGDDMVPFGVDHGTIDDAVLFPTQGSPLYPLLARSPVAWAGAITETDHRWSFFGHPLPSLGKVQDVPFWNFAVVRSETVPGFSNLSTNLTTPPTAPTLYNQNVLWSASWNAWDGPPVDQPGEWRMSFCAVAPGAQSCGGGATVQVDITPRRLQSFSVTPRTRYRWEAFSLAENRVVDSGTLAPDPYGLLTVRQVSIPPGGIRLRITAP